VGISTLILHLLNLWDGNQEGRMFECERCGSSYSAGHIGVEHCPRCRLRDQVQSPLAFRAFRPSEAGADLAPTVEAMAGAVVETTIVERRGAD
jgi:hypothetical protein